MLKNYKNLLSTKVDLILTYGLQSIQFLFAKDHAFKNYSFTVELEMFKKVIEVLKDK